MTTDRPRIVRIVDFETTDMDPPAEVIEEGLCDLKQTEAGWSVQSPVAKLWGTDQPMGPGARAAHHISPADIAGLPLFEPANLWTQAKTDGVAVVCAHNLDFEAKYWGEAELPLLCTYKAALRVWPQAPSHSNGALRYWLEDQALIAPPHHLTQPAHRAGPDAFVTAHILQALLATVTAAQMVAWTKEPRLLPACPIGKFRGKPWPEVEAGFLSWMLNQADMEADLKWNARRELDRRKQAA